MPAHSHWATSLSLVYLFRVAADVSHVRSGSDWWITIVACSATDFPIVLQAQVLSAQPPGPVSSHRWKPLVLLSTALNTNKLGDALVGAATRSLNMHKGGGLSTMQASAVLEYDPRAPLREKQEKQHMTVHILAL